MARLIKLAAEVTVCAMYNSEAAWVSDCITELGYERDLAGD